MKFRGAEKHPIIVISQVDVLADLVADRVQASPVGPRELLFNWLNNLIITIGRSVKSKIKDENILGKAEHLDSFHSVIQYLLNTCLTLRTLLSTVKCKDDKFFCPLEVHGLLWELMYTNNSNNL